MGAPAYLRAFREDEAQLLYSWLQQPPTREHLRYNFASTPAAALQFIRSANASGDNHLFAICSSELIEPVGLTLVYRSPTCARLGMTATIVGYAENRGKGFAINARRLLADIAFNRLGYDALEADILPGNLAASRFVLSFGYRLVEGSQAQPNRALKFRLTRAEWLAQESRRDHS